MQNQKKQNENQNKFSTYLEKGLTSSQVEALKEKGLVNKTFNGSYKSVSRIIFDNVFTYFNLIFFALGLCLILVKSYKDMGFLFVVFFNILIGIGQQIRSKIKIDKLNLISSLKSCVIRDGEKKNILGTEVVLNDIIIFKAGEQINVDAVVLKGQIQVDESLLTGESDSVLKKEKDKLFSGSFVLSGSCVAIVEKVGNSCYASKLEQEAKKAVEHKKSAMMNAINTIIKIIGFTIIPFAVVLFLKQTFVLNMELKSSVKTIVAVLVGMIPEGLYLLTSIALLVSVIKLIDAKVLVHEMSCIETLARVNVICVDKTGTITEPKMKVVGSYKFLTQKEEKFSLEEVLNAVIYNMPDENATSKALKAKFNLKCDWELLKVHPFLSATKWFAVEFKEQGKYVLGAPEFVLKKDYFKIKDEVEKSLNEGKRVLLLAELKGEIAEKSLKGEVVPLGLVFLENPIRKGIYKAFNFFQDQGVKIKVISGDNPHFVFNVCKKAKIKNVKNYVDASSLKTQKELKDAVAKYDIFGRVDPNQKREIVKLLQKEQKKTVAMVGDGVNDVLALRDSDVGVSMLSGSEAARHACEIVLLNSDFEYMPKIVMEGRRVINNIQRFATLFLVKNIFSFLFAFLALFFKIRFPIEPYQFTFISALTIGIPSFFLTMEPTTSIVKGSFVKNVFKKAIPGGVCNLIIMLLVQILFSIFSVNFKQLSYVSAALLGISGVIVLFEVCKPLNKLKMVVTLSMAVLMLFCIFFVKDFSNVFSLSLPAILILIFVAVLIKPILNILILIFNKIFNKTSKKS